MAARRTARRGRMGKACENGATIGYEQPLWPAADGLRGSRDAAEYKHVVRGMLPKDCAHPALDKTCLGQPIDLISDIRVGDELCAPRTSCAASTSTSSRSSRAPMGKKSGEFHAPCGVSCHSGAP